MNFFRCNGRAFEGGSVEEVGVEVMNKTAKRTADMPERLTVVERAGVYVVASEDDPDDWVACFTEDERFPARDWAERMAELYNLRGHEDRDPDKAPLFTGTHHPHHAEKHAEDHMKDHLEDKR